MKALCFFALMSLFVGHAYADEDAQTEESTDIVNDEGRVHIVWQSPEDFTDIRPSNSSRKRFRAQVFRQLDKYLEKISEDLPEGQLLKMTVTDVDLAGQVWMGGFVPLAGGAVVNLRNQAGQDIRVVNRGDIPRIHFSFQLVNADGDILREGEEKLKDMAFDTRTNPLFRRDNLRHEKWMLKRWFDNAIESGNGEAIVKNAQ